MLNTKKTATRQSLKLALLASSLLMTPQAWAQAKDWQGLFGQVGIGYQQHHMNATPGIYYSRSGSFAFNEFSSTINSFGLSLSGGYNLALSDSFLLGLGVDYNPLSTPYGNIQTYYPAVNSTARGQWRIINSYSIFVTPAWAIDESKLAYAKIGYAASQKQATSQTYNMSGWTLGLGYKQFIHKQLYAFGELNYADYGNVANRSGFSGSSKVTAFNALVGLGYRF